MAHRDDDESLFLACFPTYQLHSKPQYEYDSELWVFSSKDDEGSQNNSYLFSDGVGTRMRIISAFSEVWIGRDCILQLWAPVTIGGRLLLSTYRQPFAVSDFNEDLLKYRGRCVECGYNLNNNNFVIDGMIEQDEDQRPKIISNGLPLSAFFSRLPEMLAMNISVHHEVGPLQGYGYEECQLKFSWMMPIWDPSRSSSSSSDCIGVVEYSSPRNYDLALFNQIKEALENEGLRAFNVQDRIPYQTISGLKPTKEQIQEALETICESHNIWLAQVWISYEDDNHEHFSSSLMGTQMKQTLALKLTGYNSFAEQYSVMFWPPNEYYDACDMIPLKTGDELVLKTFQDYEPRFYRDNYKLGTDILMAELRTDDTQCSGLTICMRSIDTSDFNYAFEFIWDDNSNYVMFLEALLLTLKRCLPRFKSASGAELGDELNVIDVDNSTKSETKTFKIFQKNRSSPIAEAMEKGKKAMVVDYKAPFKAKRDTTEKPLSQEQIEQQYGKTIKEAAAALGVSESTLKRKRNQLGMGGWPEQDLLRKEANKAKKNESSQSRTNKKCNEAIEDPSTVNINEDTLIIKAEYADDTIKFDIPILEATFDTVEKEIGVRFELRLGTYRLKYRDGGDWISLLSNKDMIYYMETLRRLGQTEARLSVFIRNH